MRIKLAYNPNFALYLHPEMTIFSWNMKGFELSLKIMNVFLKEYL